MSISHICPSFCCPFSSSSLHPYLQPATFLSQLHTLKFFVWTTAEYTQVGIIIGVRCISAGFSWKCFWMFHTKWNDIWRNKVLYKYTGKNFMPNSMSIWSKTCYHKLQIYNTSWRTRTSNISFSPKSFKFSLQITTRVKL